MCYTQLPNKGNIYVYEKYRNRISNCYKLQVNEALFTLRISKSLLFISSSASIQVYEIEEECETLNGSKTIKLNEKANKKYRSTIPIDSDLKDNSLLMGDMSMPICLYEYASGEINERASSMLAIYPRAVKILNKDEFLQSDENKYLNLFTFKSKKGDDERHMLIPEDSIYLGTEATKICEGCFSKCTSANTTGTNEESTIIYGCANGEIGVLIKLEDSVYQKLKYLQESMLKVFEASGEIIMEDKPPYIKKHKSKVRFVDGRIIERLKVSDKATVDKIMANVNSPFPCTKEELMQIVNRLSKLY